MQASMDNELYLSAALAERERDTARFVAQRRALREAEPGGRGQRRAPGPWSWLTDIAARRRGRPALETEGR
jgi:hypothetical protein